MTIDMSQPIRVAVIGTGPTGLSMLKTLLEDGFDAVAFERRQRVGGVWSYAADTTMTTALPGTVANISKYTCGYTDFPVSDDYPTYLTQPDFQHFTESYAKTFNLYSHIVFDANVKRVMRNSDEAKWTLEMNCNGQHQTRQFDRVVLCHGYQTVSRIPDFEGVEKFAGEILHNQQFRDPQSMRNKKVVIVGFGATACEIGPLIAPFASQVYLSHRRGAWLLRRLKDNVPIDLLVNYSRRSISTMFQSYFPNLFTKFSNLGLRWLMRDFGQLDPEWRIPGDAPPLQLSIAQAFDDILPSLRDGSIISMHGIKKFVGPHTVEFNDGQVIENVDVVLCCTGYTADFNLTPFVETSKPDTDEAGQSYDGPPIARLYKNIFPPDYADSIAILTYSAYGKFNGFSFADVASMAISNIWRGISRDMLPSKAQMESQIDANQKWVAGRWNMYKHTDVSAVKQWEFQDFLHEAAGTGMENLGWGWKGWRFFFSDPKMSWLMRHGVETAHAYRYFETGKRSTWGGAREAIIHTNHMVDDLKKNAKSV